MKKRNEALYTIVSIIAVTVLVLMYSASKGIELTLSNVFIIVCISIIATYITLYKDFINPIILVIMSVLSLTMLYFSFNFNLDENFKTFLLTTALVMIIVSIYYASVVYTEKRNVMLVGVAAIIEKTVGNDTYVLIQTTNDRRALLDIPGGSINEDDNMTLALSKKVREETGLTLTKISGIDVVYSSNEDYFFKPFHIATSFEGNFTVVLNTFVCESMGNLKEEIDAQWININELKEIIKNNSDSFKEIHISAIKEYLRNTV